jgi:hypothetical protein
MGAMSLDVFTPVPNVIAKGATVKAKRGQEGLNGASTPPPRYWPEPATRYLKTGHLLFAPIDDS